MKGALNRLLADSGFGFRPGFSERVMHILKRTVQMKDASLLLTERIRRMFYWINIPMAATLLVLMLLFFLNNHREKKVENSPGAELSEYVFDYYVSNQSEIPNYD